MGTILDDPSADIVIRADEHIDPFEPRIRCPVCNWSPGEHDLWGCRCGHAWNTFDTGGVCPACLFQWTSTQCPMCGQWSPHSDWYQE